MVIYDSRKKTLAETYGTSGCIDTESWFKASFNDLQGNMLLYSDDMRWLYRDGVGYCVEEEEETPTKLIVREYNGISADVINGDEVIGKTNKFIEIAPGDYELEITKTGYEPQTISVVVNAGKTTEYKYVKLIKIEEEQEPNPENPPSEYETPGTLGPVLVLTGNVKLPDRVTAGVSQWFGWEFKNTGDADWRGVVGLRLVGTDGEFRWEGDSTKKQTIAAGETKYVWAYTKVDNVPTGTLSTYALMTRTT